MLVLLLLCFVAHCFCISDVSFLLSSFDKNQLYAKEPVIISTLYKCDSPCGSSISFIFDFGDGNTITTTNTTISHTYSSSGWFSISLSAQDSATSSSSSFSYSFFIQPPQECYSFQIFMKDENGEERETIIVNQGTQVPIYARVVDPSILSLSRSYQLTLLYDSIGEFPSIVWDYTIPYSPSPYETPFSTSFSFNANKTTGVWDGTLISKENTQQIYPKYITLSGRVTSRGIGALGCSIRDSPFSATVSRFPSSHSLSSSPTAQMTAEMMTANYNPTFLRISRDPCSVNSGISLLGDSTDSSLFGGLLLTTDDSFGPSTTMIDLIQSGEGPLCAAFPTVECSSIVVYDIKFVSSGQIVILTSRGLAATYTNSSGVYNIVSLTTGSAIDNGLGGSSNAKLFSSSACQQVDEMTGPNYVYLSYSSSSSDSSSSSSSLVTFTFFNEENGNNVSTSSWVTLDISSFTSSGRNCTGAVWNSDSKLHTLLLSGSSSEAPIILSCSSIVCDITFTFPIGTILSSMTTHHSGNDILVVGDSVWYSILGTTSFYKLADLESGEIAESVVTTDHHTAYAILSNTKKVYYGRIAVRDTLVIPSPLSLISGDFVSNILFDSLGQLFSLYLDTPASLSTVLDFPIGLYLNSAGELRSFSDTTVLHKTELLVAGSISSSNYALPSSCPLSLLIQGDEVLIRSMQSGCTLETNIEYRALKLTNGGSIILLRTINGTTVPGQIAESLVSLSLTSSLANASISFYPVSGGCSVSVASSSAGFSNTDIGKTIVYRLDSIFLTTFTDSTHMTGTSLSCLSGFISDLSRFSSSSREVILNGAGIFPFPDGPTSDGLGWQVPSGDWDLYDLSSSSQYSIVAECSYSYLGFSQGIELASDSGHPVVYLDIGDEQTASVLVAPPDTPLDVFLSNTLATGTQVANTHSSVSSIGLDVNNVTFSLTEGLQQGGMTIMLRPQMTSLACEMANTALRVVHGCPPAKILRVVRPYSFDEFISGSISSYSLTGWPMLVDLEVNYRPPSPFGKAIPTTQNIYNADPSHKRHRDTFKISKRTGQFKQCEGKTSHDECGCTDVQRYYAMVQNSDCVDKVFAWSWREAYIPQFVIENNGEVINVLADYTVTELNGRTDYCFNISDINCKSSEVENYTIMGTNYIGIRFQGSELYHFRINVTGYYTEDGTKLTSYCNLTTEIAVWAYNPPLSQTTAWLTVALTAVVIVMLLFGAFLLYSYLYTSESTT